MRGNITAGGGCWGPEIRRAVRLGVLGLLLSGGTAWAGNDTASPGEEAYFRNCAICHGDDATGGMASVPDITQRRSWRELSEDAMVARLMEGVQTPGSSMPMPPAGGNPDLGADEVRQAFRYMRDVLMKPE